MEAQDNDYSQFNAIRSRALLKGTLVVLGLAVGPSQGYPCDLTIFCIVWALRGLPIFRKVGVVGKGTLVILRGPGVASAALRRAFLEHVFRWLVFAGWAFCPCDLVCTLAA